MFYINILKLKNMNTEKGTPPTSHTEELSREGEIIKFIDEVIADREIRIESMPSNRYVQSDRDFAIHYSIIEEFKSLKNKIQSSQPVTREGEVTAMQMLLEFITGEDGQPMDGYKHLFAKATELLAKEREQIEKAVNDCWTVNDKKGYIPDGSTYFTNTYK